MRSHTARDLLLLPNILSAARIPLAALVPFTTERASLLALVGAAGLTDLLDGWMARRLAEATPTGAALDGFADKVFGVSLLATLVRRKVLAPSSALLLGTRELLELPLAIRVLLTRRERAAAVDHSANVYGKIATALELSAVVASLMRARLARPLVLAAGIAGAVAGVSYWRRELRAARAYARSREVDLPVPYLLAGGRPERLASLAAA